MDVPVLDIRLFCEHAPPAIVEGKPAEFGLQDKDATLIKGRALPKGVLAFDCPIDITQDDPPKFRGRFVHGTPQARFLYLSYRLVGAQGWIKRIKVPLNGITAEQIAKLYAEPNTTLAVRVDGRHAATVRVEWGLVER
jgi:Family of unknown function (DUF5990)